MLILTNTTDKIEMVVGTAADIDTHVSGTDMPTPITPSSNATPFRQNQNRTTAATHELCAVPAASTVRNVKTIHIVNKDTADSTDITVQYDASGTDTVLHKCNLAPGEALEYIEGIGFFEIGPSVSVLPSGSGTTAAIASHSADTYYLGIPVTTNGLTRLQAGCFFRWSWRSTKGAAGTAAPTYNIRFGTAGTTGDTSRCLMTGTAQTAAADSAKFLVEATFRVVGASAVIQGAVWIDHFLAITGFTTTVNHHALVETTGAAFDSTPNNSIIGLSVNPGASGAWVTNQVTLDAVGLIR